MRPRRSPILAAGPRRRSWVLPGLATWGRNTPRAEVLFFLDADVVAPADAVAQVKRVFADHADLDAVIGSYDTQPAATNFTSQYKNLFNHYVHQHAREEGFTFWGACGAIRKETFDRLDGFDESFARPCVEDIELGYRLRAAGGEVRVVKQLQVKHLKRWSMLGWLRSDLLDRAVPWTQLIHRSGGFDDDLNIDRSSRLKVAMVGLTCLFAIGSFWQPWLLVTCVALLLIMIAFDLPLLRFFAQQRGVLFAMQTIPWQWLYYFNSGLGFALGTAAHFFNRSSRRSSGGNPVADSAEEDPA